MQLHVQTHSPTAAGQYSSLVFIHGLFGSLSNLGMLARAFEEKYHVVQIDLRNHGKSKHVESMDYLEMAQDVLDTLDHLKVDKFSVIGHSMGAKVAMKMTEIAENRLEQLVVLDMAPVAYQQNHHDQIFKALFAVNEADVSSRKEATEIMNYYISEAGVIMFLLKSWSQGQWLFNVNTLSNSYPEILSWKDVPIWQQQTLFIRGGNSEYISKPEHFSAIEQQFSQHQLITIEDAGHWLHAEKTDKVVSVIQNFLN